MKILLAKKIGMTQLFDENGRQSSVTLLDASDCIVTQLKDMATDGYDAVQLGINESKKIRKPQLGHQKKAKSSRKNLAEFRVNKDNKLSEEEITIPAVGQAISADVFEIGDVVSVQSVSKGKGFAGTIKRHNFSRGPKTHGSHNYRAPGSIGAGYPQHVFRGQKMAGQMGGDTVTVKNLKVSYIDSKQGIIGIAGAVPGPKKALVRVVGSQA